MTPQLMSALTNCIKTLCDEHKKLIDAFIPAQAIGAPDAKSLADQARKIEIILSKFSEADTEDKLLQAAKEALDSLKNG